jgi:hypothetical protein
MAPAARSFPFLTISFAESSHPPKADASSRTIAGGFLHKDEAPAWGGPSMLRLLVLLVALAGASAGCMGPSAPTASKQDDAVAPAAVDTVPLANATVTPNATVMAPPVPIAYGGTSPTGACTFGTPADQCQFSSAGTESFHVVEAKGKPTHVAVRITYGAQQPGMTFYATICEGKRGDAASFHCGNYTTAASPMVLEKDLRALPADGAIAISLGSLDVPPTPAGAMVFASVDFKVQGMLTVAG